MCQVDYSVCLKFGMIEALKIKGPKICHTDGRSFTKWQKFVAMARPLL